jgi:anaerobic selenocysteine-containing dehydrogenase
VHLVETIVQGSVFMPFHWGDLFAPQQAANYLTSNVVDPISKQPEFKVCQVRIQKAELLSA